MQNLVAFGMHIGEGDDAVARCHGTVVVAGTQEMLTEQGKVPGDGDTCFVALQVYRKRWGLPQAPGRPR